MRSWTAPDIYRPIKWNVLLYDGPSQLTGDRILVIASAQNGNRKIGHMLQLWILTAISPKHIVIAAHGSRAVHFPRPVRDADAPRLRDRQ